MSIFLRADHRIRRRLFLRVPGLCKLVWATLLTLLSSLGLTAQTNVLTQHNDISRSGSNVTETILTPGNVSASTFGKLFSFRVDGRIYAQPLYVHGVVMGAGTPQAGTTHNVIFVATEHDSLYAFDADNNGGANANPLWQVTLLDAAHGAASGATSVPNSDVSTNDIVPEVGITGTPVIDSSTNTIYVVGKTKENGVQVERLHALDITSGAEKFAGPVALAAQVAGTGNGSSAGTLVFDPMWANQRPGLLLLNGIVYIGFAAHGDNGPWHGWILAYRASNLAQTGVWCTSPNGIGGGIWMSGAGLAADLPPGLPYGRMFVATGNGDYTGSLPYTNTKDYGDSIVRLDLTNGVPTVSDEFTPYNQSWLNGSDADVAAGGVLLLPDQTGAITHNAVQVGKEGKVYVTNRDAMSGYNPAADTIQEVAGQTGGLWSMPAYWNGNIYFWGNGNNLKAFSFTGGKLSTTPTSISGFTSGFPGATPAISSNGTTNGIVWAVRTDTYNSNGPAILFAFDATNVATQLYNSTLNTCGRDTAGPSVKFVVPTVTNGKVYVGAAGELDVYGLLNGLTQAATPVISPIGQTFSGSLSVSITDVTSGAIIYYTVDGTTPTTASTVYTGPITVSTSETIKAIATASGFVQCGLASQTYTLQTQTPTPTFSPASGSYTTAQSVTLSDSLAGANIYYTTDGSTPTTSSAVYSSPISVASSTTIKALATSTTLSISSVANALYTIVNGGTGVNYSSGFSSAASSMTFNGSTGLDDTRLQLTSGATNQAGSAFVNAPINIQSFTTDFLFQLSNPAGDGFTFTIQGNSPTALGPAGGGLGYGPDSPSGAPGMLKSVAVKFDLYNNMGEGPSSTGLYLNGVSPTTPFTDLTPSGIDLHSGDTMAAHITYDGTTLAMTITDSVANKTFSTSWPVNIPSNVGGNTAYVGFTGGTGGATSSQKIETWTFVSAGSVQPSTATPIFSLAAGTFLGTQMLTITDATSASTIYYTTDGSTPTTSSTKYTTAIAVNVSETIKAIAVAGGLQNSAVTSAAYVIESQVPPPVFSPAPGTYSTPQSVTISDSTAGSTIYYTTDGSTPTTASTIYTVAVPVTASKTIKAFATANGFFNSNVATATYTIQIASGITFATGFSATGLAFNGNAAINGTRLRLTDTGANEAGSAWFATPVNIQAFTTDFTLQLTTANADGFAFVVQNTGTKAIGPAGGGLGYGPDKPSSPTASANVPIAKSVALKFDLYNNFGEGGNSTGLFINGASPTVPATALGGGVSLHTGDVMKAHVTYDGVTLVLTITDTVNTAQTFTTSWPVNIPSMVGANTAYVGFTGGTGGSTATQEIITWTYNNTAAPLKTPVVYATTSLPAVSSGPTFRQFTYPGFPDTTGTILDATKVGDNVTFTVNVAAAGTYDVKISYKKINTRGIWQLAVNGANAGPTVDEFQASGDSFATVDLGTVSFPTAGNYTFKFTVTGKNTSSSSYGMAFDDFTLTPQ